jgi:hypothetical protein
MVSTVGGRGNRKVSAADVCQSLRWTMSGRSSSASAATAAEKAKNRRSLSEPTGAVRWR